ncbi:F-box only protein 25 isoform X1 [Ursus americanus]|uniref:F-box only protein 25 isoform X1 n=1 Tax=Ursus americanus TaxID=9643 RepID=UPI001E679925|nr:F-box only protein 25 isoform X1 [Ursus americanus]XP_045667131.1 F-box only protein 25 isoform X1 [Ursus americanus]XP_045667132.1 F-box only protein 25 isoform X1 [Ursus americanus]XP_045667133.1 F-box only protein 25 isoform X1 [Ursus americanus]
MAGRGVNPGVGIWKARITRVLSVTACVYHSEIPLQNCCCCVLYVLVCCFPFSFVSSVCPKVCFTSILNSDDEEIFSNEEQEYTSKKRKKDHFRNDTNTQCFYREKWIYVHKESTRERHGYCTLGEAFNRLDFSSAIQDIRRFTYVVKLLQLIAKSQLTSLSGVAQKNYFNILDKIVQKVLDDHQNPRLIKDLLQDLSSTLCILIRGVGKSVLVGNINIWICRLETILRWQQQLQNLQVTKVNDGLTLSDLPLHMLNNILYRFSDGWDIVTLGQVTPTLSMLSEDRRLWKKLCQYHFAEKQFCRHLILSEKGHVEWKLMYFALQKHYPPREQYGDTLHFCRHCSILFWKDCRLALLFKDSGHPCTAADPDSCFMPVSPQHFIDLFKF